jgi:hypothetical protein
MIYTVNSLIFLDFNFCGLKGNCLFMIHFHVYFIYFVIVFLIINCHRLQNEASSV